MKTENVIIGQLIEHIRNKLTGDIQWSHPTPRTFVYESIKVFIFVYVTDQNIVVTNDGKNVVDGMEMIRLGSLKHLEDDTDEYTIDLREQVFDGFLNRILDCL